MRLGLVSLIVVGLAAQGACYRDRAASGVPAAQIENTVPRRTTNPLAFLPVDSELVLHVDAQQISRSALWKQYLLPSLLKDRDLRQWLDETKARCGFDPMTALSSFSAGLRDLTGDHPDGVIVLHGLNKASSLACVEKYRSKIVSGGYRLTNEGDVILLDNGPVDRTALLFVDDSTAIMVIGPNGTKAGAMDVARGGTPLKTSRQFVDMYGKLKTTHSVWFLVNGTSKALESLSRVGVKTKAIFGSINLSDRLALDVRLRAAAPDEATRLSDLVNGMVHPFAGMVDGLDVRSDGTDVRIGISASQQQLKTLWINIGAQGGVPAP